MKPSIGRIVHFVLDSGKSAGSHRAAIIVNVIGEGLAALTVFPDTARDGIGSSFHTSSTRHDESGRPGTWHWPERDEPNLFKAEVLDNVSAGGSNE